MKQFKYIINGNTYNVIVNKMEDATAEVEVNGVKYSVEMEKPEKKNITTAFERPAQPITTPVKTPVVARPAVPSTVGAVKSPLPGIILSIDCKVGDTIKRGQKLLVLEAMKMENNINSDRDGQVIEIKVNQGDSVLEGADLVVVG